MEMIPSSCFGALKCRKNGFVEIIQHLLRVHFSWVCFQLIKIRFLLRQKFFVQILWPYGNKMTCLVVVLAIDGRSLVRSLLYEFDF